MTSSDKVFAALFVVLMGMGWWKAEFAVAASLLYVGYAIDTRPKK